MNSFQVIRLAHGDYIVLWRGQPVYKRWPSGRSIVFDPYGSPWSPQEFDRDKERAIQ